MIDVAEARDLFDASTDGTVGIEEEFALLDPTLGSPRRSSVCATPASRTRSCATRSRAS